MRKSLKRILLWSEKYTKTDMLYLTKGGFWLGAGYGIQVLSGFVLAIAFANLLPKHEYGTYQFIMSVAVILGTCTLSGMNIAVKRATSQGIEGALQYGFRTQIKWSIGITLASAIVALYYFSVGNNTLGISFLIIAAFSPFIEGFSLYKSYLIGKKRFQESAFLGFWRRPLLIVTVLSTLFLTDEPVIIVLVYFTTSAISAGLLYRLVVKKYKLKPIPNPEIIEYSKHLSVIGILSTIGNNIDKLLVFHFLGPIPLAIYMLALLPIVHLQKMFGFIGNDLLFPKLVQKDFNEIRQRISYKVLIFFFVTLFITAFYFILAPFLYMFLFPAYPEAILLSQVGVLALLVKPAMIYAQVFSAHGMKKTQHIITIFTLLGKLVIFATFIPFFGIWGAIYGIILTQILWASIVTVLFYFRKTQGETNALFNK